MGLFRKRISLERQLEALARAGLVVNAVVLGSDLTTFHDRDELERKPYQGLIWTLGFDIEREPFTPICDRLWMCDFERIEDSGDYTAVIERLERMTSSALHLDGITDHVDVEDEEAWVEFDCAGRRVHLDLEVDDDWLDPQVFIHYDALLKDADAAVRLYINQRDFGQSSLLGAFTRAEQAVFDKLSRVRIPLPH